MSTLFKVKLRNDLYFQWFSILIFDKVFVCLNWIRLCVLHAALIKAKATWPSALGWCYISIIPRRRGANWSSQNCKRGQGVDYFSICWAAWLSVYHSFCFTFIEKVKQVALVLSPMQKSAAMGSLNCDLVFCETEEFGLTSTHHVLSAHAHQSAVCMRKLSCGVLVN